MTKQLNEIDMLIKVNLLPVELCLLVKPKHVHANLLLCVLLGLIVGTLITSVLLGELTLTSIDLSASAGKYLLMCAGCS